MRAAGRPNGGVRTPRAISARSDDDRRGGRHAAGAGTDQRDRRQPVGIDRHRVGHAHHLGDGGVLRHHGRMHALLDAGFGSHRHAQQLDAVAELGRGVEIGERDRGNALDVNRVGIDLGAEREARQDGKLLRGVVAFDVEGRIGLGITEPLRLAQAFVEREPVLLHAREDVIAGAVEDAVDARERVAVEPLAQRLHDRDAAGDRRLEIERDAVAFGQRRQAYGRAGRAAPCWRSPPACRRQARSRPPAWPDRPAPPISSTKHVDRRDRAASATGSATQRNFFRSKSRFLPRERALTRDDLDRPAAARRRACRGRCSNRWTTAVPTVPSPARPTFSGSAINVANLGVKATRD